jgi:hypothetical protein
MSVFVFVAVRGAYPTNIGHLFHRHSRMLLAGIQSGFASGVLRLATKMVCH